MQDNMGIIFPIAAVSLFFIGFFKQKQSYKIQMGGEGLPLATTSGEIPDPIPNPPTQRDPINYPANYSFTPSLMGNTTIQSSYAGPETQSVRPPGMAQQVQPPFASLTFTPSPIPPPKYHTLETSFNNITPSVRPPGNAEKPSAYPIPEEQAAEARYIFFFPGTYILNTVQSVIGSSVVGASLGALAATAKPEIKTSRLTGLGTVAGGIVGSFNGGGYLPVTFGSICGGITSVLAGEQVGEHVGEYVLTNNLADYMIKLMEPRK